MYKSYPVVNGYFNSVIDNIFFLIFNALYSEIIYTAFI